MKFYESQTCNRKHLHSASFRLQGGVICGEESFSVECMAHGQMSSYTQASLLFCWSAHWRSEVAWGRWQYCRVFPSSHISQGSWQYVNYGLRLTACMRSGGFVNQRVNCTLEPNVAVMRACSRVCVTTHEPGHCLLIEAITSTRHFPRGNGTEIALRRSLS